MPLGTSRTEQGSGADALQPTLALRLPGAAHRWRSGVPRQTGTIDIIGFKCCHRSSVHQKLAAGDDKQRGDGASRTQAPARDPRCLLW